MLPASSLLSDCIVYCFVWHALKVRLHSYLSLVVLLFGLVFYPPGTCLQLKCMWQDKIILLYIAQVCKAEPGK